MERDVIDLTSEPNENEGVDTWRKEINPFPKYGFLYGSSFHFFSRLKDSREEGNSIVNDQHSINDILPETEDVLTENENSISNLPYHVEFFDLIVANVTKRKVYHDFFSKEEKEHVLKYNGLSLQCKELYMRLFQRKRCWIREKTIHYANIDNKVSIKELLAEKFVVGESNLTQVDDVLNLLSAGEIKELSSEFKMGKGCTNKGAIITFLKNCCKNQRTIFGGRKSMEDIVVKRYHLLQIKTGQIIYPKYEIESGGISFVLNSRDEFVKLTTAINLETDFNTYIEANDLENCYTIYKQAYQLLKESCNTVTDGNKIFLQRFSCFWIFLRICRNSINVMEKLKKYQEAVEAIDFLLDLPCIHAKHRGMLWERKIIDLERHLKLPSQALSANESAVADLMVRGHFHYTLKQRLEKKKKKKTSIQSDEFELQYFKEVEIDVLQATSVLDTSSASRAVFMSPKGGGNVMSNVEQYVLEYYKDQGFTGVHDEGSIITTIFVLLFWDIIFKQIPQTLLSEYQIAPLDFFNDAFYYNRKNELDGRLNFVYKATKEDLRNKISHSWEEHFGQNMIGANWSLFSNKQEAVDVTLCLKPAILGGVCEVLCKDFRSRRSGFPDLILWKADENKCKIIEVKGPGDKLSPKQIVWLDILQYLGADVIVCHVTGIGAKRKFISLQDDA